ncbi:hypothetical protein ISS07_00095 [Candidatus Woesearchaeota archaeon]|nr:hypothetical protein [Candidatus Woesearchaeota archaeon]
MKKAQVTTFMVLGIILLVSASLIFYISEVQEKNKLKSQSDIQNLVSGDKASIKVYVESCISAVSEPLIKEIAFKGGSFQSPLSYKNEEITPLASYVSGFGINNLMVTKRDMELELNKKIKEKISSCINLDNFRKHGFKVSAGELTVSTIIAIEDVNVNLNFPLNLEKANNLINLNDYFYKVQLPLGNLFAAAIDIVNAESFGYFDKESYVIENRIKIEKKKPYPNTIYELSQLKSDKPLIFRFALEGRDTVGKEVLTYGKKGCCTSDNICYKNVEKSSCNGEYDSSLNCGCEQNYEPQKLGCCKTSFSCSILSEEECSGQYFEDDISCSKAACPNLNCRSTYNYQSDDFSNGPRNNGESWCNVESITGSGFDFVGTRHYVHSCVNGQELVEPCRDFREETCSETSENSKTIARCRTNRWYDCAQQTDQASCENSQVRDCTWTYWLQSQKKCHPNVPPGLKFWEDEGKQVCSAGSFSKDRNGYLYPRSWAHGTALYCLRVGDCGNYRNSADIVSELGYYNPEIVVPQWVYGNPGLNRGSERNLNEPFEINNENFASISTGSGINAICDLWQPNSDFCEYCNSSKLHECSEYKCKSLGRGCVFVEEDSSCIQEVEVDRIPVEIFDMSFANNTFSQRSAGSYDGSVEYLIKESILEYEPLMFSFSTSKPSRCKASIFPPDINDRTREAIAALGSASPEVILNKQKYQSNFTASVRLPSASFTQLSSYQLFIRCMDKFGNENKESIIKVRSKEGNVGMEIIKVRPAVGLFSTGKNLVSLFTNKPFDGCRYSTQEMPYESMNLLNCSASDNSIVYNPGSPYGSFVCKDFVEVPDNTEKLFFMCEDKEGNKNKIFVQALTS